MFNKMFLLLFATSMLSSAYSQNATTDTTNVTIKGREFFLNGVSMHFKGVNWNPVPVGYNEQDFIDWSGDVEQDGELMKQAGINVLRTYWPVTNLTILDSLYQKGIYVMMTVYRNGYEASETVVPVINAVKNHPAVVTWVIGNEWNYNGLYDGMSHYDCIQRINYVAGLIRQNDESIPIATIYGGYAPDSGTIDAMPLMDYWGLNVYTGISFGNLFNQWESLSTMPLMMTEYGGDAWNANIPGVDLESQRVATYNLTYEIQANSVLRGGVMCASVIFEFSDEWWKVCCDDQQDVGGNWGGSSGPYPDGVYNEEYWGIVDVNRNVRPAYTAYKEIKPVTVPSLMTQGCDFSEDGNLGNVNYISDPDDCVEICKNETQCTKVSWNTYIGGTCWLKSDSASKVTTTTNVWCATV